jgi:hypothetical protein
MRVFRLIALIAAILAAAPASASDTASTKERANNSSSTTSSGSSAQDRGLTIGGQTPNSISATGTDNDFGLLRQLSGKNSAKWWEVGIEYEIHRLIVQNDLEGAAVNALFNYYSAYVQLDLTPYDRISVRAGMYEYFLADAGETGVRADDVQFVYSRRIPLPGAINMRISAYLTAPASYGSYLATLVTEPSASVLLSRRFGDFELSLRGLAHYYVVKYSTDAGGNANPQWAWGGEVRAEYDFWFLRSLTLGADIFTEYTKAYNVYPNNDPYVQSLGYTVPSYGGNQPIQQVYGGEVYLRYTLPKLAGIGSDITLAAATGDPAVGYPSVIHDGRQAIYAFWRQNSELYAAISIRY